MAIDSKYEKYAIPCLNSIRVNWNSYPKIYLFNKDGLSENFLKFCRGFNIEIVSSYERHDYTNLGPVSNGIVYDKYNCWNPKYFGAYDNVLHLDCDTIVLKNLDNIFHKGSFFIDNNETLPNVKAFKDMQVNMCNAGVFVVNKKYITEYNYDNLHSYTRKYMDSCNYADQSIISLWNKNMNILLSDEVYYNFQPSFINYKDNEDNRKYNYEDIKVIHYTARKPDTIHFRTWWRVDGYSDIFYKEWKKYEN